MSVVTLPRAGMPLVGAGNVISREWYRWAHDLTERVGGTTAMNWDDLEMLAWAASTQPQAGEGAADSGDAAPAVVQMLSREALETQIAELSAMLHAALQRIEALEQGVNV